MAWEDGAERPRLAAVGAAPAAHDLAARGEDLREAAASLATRGRPWSGGGQAGARGPSSERDGAADDAIRGYLIIYHCYGYSFKNHSYICTYVFATLQPTK